MKTFESTPIPFKIKDLNARVEPSNVVICTPDFFEVVDVKNVHMQGQIGQTNASKSKKQWDYLYHLYQNLVARNILDACEVIQGVPGAEDMVFAANPCFPWISESGQKQVVLSNMVHPSRQMEVPHFKDFFEKLNYEIISLPPHLNFEGNGDLIPHPFKRLLYGGYGKRTHKEAHTFIAEKLDTPIILLELIDDRFYHLDTCFRPLSETTVMICPEAFTFEGYQMICEMFENVIRVSSFENTSFFAMNCHAFDVHQHKIAMIHFGSTTVANHLKNNGFEVFEVDTSEFMKSGGSVFCMKLMYY